MKILINDLLIFFIKMMLGMVGLGGAILSDPVNFGNIVLALFAGAMYTAALTHVTFESMTASAIALERKSSK
jgi:hypothetical protein